MKKITLSSAEKTNLILNKKIEVVRQLHIPAPSTSILYGKGNRSLWDKIDYRWVYGNTAEYITNKKNQGRRAIDYPDNTPNTWNGRTWWGFDKEIDEYSTLKTKCGLKSPIYFIITDYYVSALNKKENSDLLTINITYTLNISE